MTLHQVGSHMENKKCHVLSHRQHISCLVDSNRDQKLIQYNIRVPVVSLAAWNLLELSSSINDYRTLLVAFIETINN